MNSKCTKCGAGLPEPTIRSDLLEGGLDCQSCGTRQQPSQTTEQWLVQLWERLDYEAMQEGWLKRGTDS